MAHCTTIGAGKIARDQCGFLRSSADTGSVDSDTRRIVGDQLAAGEKKAQRCERPP